MDILDQMILGSANTPHSIEKLYQKLNLSMSSLNLVSLPKECHSYTFKNLFDYCVRNKCGIPIGVYKKIDDFAD